MAAEVISTLRGKVIHKNNRKVEYGEQIEAWSPYNADLHMQGIKVMVKEPMPKKVEKGDAFEDTMLLLEMMKEKKQKENKMQKEEMIRAMAMEKKRKLSNQSSNQYLKLTFLKLTLNQYTIVTYF
eukprot:TRINITY_DN10937_c0_g1_i3.p1 TRINITY_DN10937_c0_g1~~TRINITY_DN10937_c0_g1_i3.p1  ORF type:complete len:125 (-),score=39.23 TRINITY_DN10937_c0_g1_i3:25-399(-)